MQKYHIAKDINAPDGAEFPNKRHIALPPKILETARSMPLTRNIFLTRTGHFPNAAGHFVERKTPINEWILIYCTDGKGWCAINDEKYDIYADIAVLIPAGVPHAYAADKRSPWTIYWVHLIGDHVQEYAKALNATIKQPVLHLKHGGQLIHHFDEFYSVLNYGYTPPALLALSTSLAHFLGELNLQRSRTGQHDFAIEDTLHETIEFMHLNIYNTLSLKQLAQYARMSVSHYTNNFRKLTGMTPISFFIDLKMRKASELLHEPNRKIKDIAAIIGFEDPYYFSRCFKKAMGCSPASYRKLHL
ncbi:MAG: AraC family transcriptional regulator [Kiritimatiellae bacterium]|jgi:AraC-like DNA-binding protein|nr:AraC family transcriptional regulator [Kiritimatiellia bacterium]